MQADSPIAITPIGVVHSSMVHKADAPRQGRLAKDVEARLELFAGFGYEDALRDIEGFDYLWLIFHFNRAEGWRPTVLPPRSGVRRGVFATRAPRRPSGLGLSVVRLVRREGLVLYLAESDLLDGTPVFDIKPYLAWADAIPDASAGWLPRPDDPGETFNVVVSAHAEAQFRFLATQSSTAVDLQDLRRRVIDHLTLGPRPHAYRRIRPEDDAFVLSVAEWRVIFAVTEDPNIVVVEHLRTGMRPKQLALGTAPASHIAFEAKFGLSGRKESHGLE